MEEDGGNPSFFCFQGVDSLEEAITEPVTDVSEQVELQQVEVINKVETEVTNAVETNWLGIEGIDYERYTSNSVAFTVRHEITYGDILVSTLIAFLIVFMIIKFFHGLILGGKK